MAEGGVMPVKDHWVVLSPSRRSAELKAAILDEASARGLAVREADAPEDGSGRPAIIVTDDVAAAHQAGAADEAVTVIALEPFIPLSGLAPEEVHGRVDAVSRKIAQAHGFSGRVVRRLDDAPDLPGLEGFRFPVLSQGQGGASRRETALQKAMQVFQDGEAQWSAALFSIDRGDAESEASNGLIDLTGKPRFLLAGPYLWMPAGAWRAVVRLSFDHEVSHRRFRVDWGGVADYASYEFHPGQGGVFEITLEHYWDQSAAAELRVVVLEGIFHGTMSFGGATISRIDSRPSGA